MQSQSAHIFHALLEYDQGVTGIIEYAFMPNLKKFDQVLGVYSGSQVVKVKFPSPYIPFAATQVEIWEPDGPGKADRPDRPDLPPGDAGRGIRESIVTPTTTNRFAASCNTPHCIRTGSAPRTPAADGRDDVRLCIELAKAASPETGYLIRHLPDDSRMIVTLSFICVRWAYCSMRAMKCSGSNGFRTTPSVLRSAQATCSTNSSIRADIEMQLMLGHSV